MAAAGTERCAIAYVTSREAWTCACTIIPLSVVREAASAGSAMPGELLVSGGVSAEAVGGKEPAVENSDNISTGNS